MNMLTSFVDVAGRVSRSTEVFHRVTAAAVTLVAAALDSVRASLPQDSGKWSGTDLSRATRMVDLMIAHAVAVGALSVNKQTPAWQKYWDDSLALETLIRAQDGRAAGFLRAPNVLRFHLMGGSAAVAFGHANHRTQHRPRIVDHLGRTLLDHELVFDTDIQGAENEEMLEIMMDQPMPKSEKEFGLTVKRHMSLKTEQQEPLLLMADFAAGIVHAALLPDANGSLPLTQEEASSLLNRLHDAGLLAIHQQDFNFDCRDVFGNLMDLLPAVSS